jgi:2-polyprenyl-6-methoxyphenol hydroxylase-like FAD-dependent oxidoreductase
VVSIKNVLVVGGGISGMCVAIQLRKLGFAVDLVEINPEGAVYGTGITLSGPTLRAFRSIGVLEQVLAAGASWNTMDIMSAGGEPLAQVPIPPSQGAEDLPPAAAILRPVLARILADATRASGAMVRLGVTFKSITQDADGVDVDFTDGNTSRYDLVIGADGVNSKVRELIFPGAPLPKFTGQGSWRAVAPRTVIRSTIFLGATTKAGVNPISADEMYLYCLDHRDNFEFIAQEQCAGLLAGLLGEFGSVIGDIRRAIESAEIPDCRIVYRPLMGLMMPAPWHRGRVVLLGDTVHATTPHLAMGAGIAVEDAVVLPEELAHATTLDDALNAYVARRFERCRLVVEGSMRLGELEQTGGSKDEHTQVMRDALGKLTAPI